MKPKSTDSPRYREQKLAAIRAAASVFSEKGFHGASTRDIAERLKSGAVMSELQQLESELHQRESLDVAIQLSELAARCRRTFGDDAEVTLQAIHRQLSAERTVGRLESAETLARELVARRRA